MSGLLIRKDLIFPISTKICVSKSAILQRNAINFPYPAYFSISTKSNSVMDKLNRLYALTSKKKNGDDRFDTLLKEMMEELKKNQSRDAKYNTDNSTQKSNMSNSKNRNLRDTYDENKNYMTKVGAILFFLFVFYYLSKLASTKDITWRQFEEIIGSNNLAEIIFINNNTIKIRTHNSQFFRLSFVSNDIFIQKLSECCEKYNLNIDDIKFTSRDPLEVPKSSSIFNGLFAMAVMAFILYKLSSWFMKKVPKGDKNIQDMLMDMSGFNSKNFSVFRPSKDKITFKDVRGCDSAKIETREFVDFLKNPKDFTNLGARIPKGAILYGPPGTGKTLIAKAVAGEANVPFIYSSGSEFIEMIVGMGARRIRKLFSQAKEISPCIVFIDEIDAIGSKRSRISSHSENDQTINQLLCELDGFDTDSNIVLLCGTNQYNKLDPALTRSGRLDRKIYLAPPSIDGRVELFDLYLSKIKIDQNLRADYSKRLAELTPGSTGADIVTVCNEGAILAARSKKSIVELVDLEQAHDRLILGNKLNKKLSEQEKYTVSIHEAGHAVVSWYLKNTLPILKISIIPRGESLGANQFLPSEDNLTSKEQLIDMVAVTLGGRAAEELMIGSITTGAVNDLEKVTELVYRKVGLFGMDSDVGLICYPSIAQRFSGRDSYSPSSEYGPDLANKIDKCVRSTIAMCYERAKDVILANRESLLKLSDLLLEKEVISTAEIEQVLGPRPTGSSVPPVISCPSPVQQNEESSLNV